MTDDRAGSDLDGFHSSNNSIDGTLVLDLGILTSHVHALLV